MIGLFAPFTDQMDERTGQQRSEGHGGAKEGAKAICIVVILRSGLAAVLSGTSRSGAAAAAAGRYLNA